MSVKEFVKQWANVAGERANYQKFWLTLIRDLFGIDKPENFIQFEMPVTHGFIDGYFPDSKVLVEQKSSAVNLDAEVFAQAKRYNDALEYSRKARWIVTCNFREFLIYDMETLAPPVKIALEELPAKYHALDFLIDFHANKLRLELELSLQAGEIVAKIYDALLAQYVNPNSAESLASLNKLCVRLVFCLYAESAGIFGKHKIFRDYLNGARNIRRDLLDLFDVLNTPLDKRDPYLDDTLKKFPYVNGGLFEGTIEIPNFTPQIKELLLEEASSGFNWSGISPTIFGAVFESTLNPETRRAGGMHYTSIENIHKVIDPLFLDDLKAEFATLKSKKQLAAFHDKLAQIKIFDPACGSGNFLTESYLSLRRLENELLKVRLGSQITLGELDNPIRVSIGNFYGIEINDFAVAVAQTALWIAELQMMIETREIIHRDLDFLPLKSYANIIKANALRVDWKSLVPAVDYIIGNPPFVGYSNQTKAQKLDMQDLFVDTNGKPYKKAGKIDYVAGWYLKAGAFMSGTSIRGAFVSTNSVMQGEQVAPLWKTILDDYNMQIAFARRPFKWTSESPDLAAVNCVVIGMADKSLPVSKRIFDADKVSVAQNICPYLFDSPNVFIRSRARHFQKDVPRIFLGNKPSDGGNLILSPAEREDILKREPTLEKFIRRYVGGNEFINNVERYCLWLVDATPAELRGSRELYRRLEDVKKMREASSAKPTRQSAATPYKFFFVSQPTTDYILIPQTSAGARKYIPMGFMPPNVIASNSTSIILDATLYHFGVLTSSIHMAWMRIVAGYLGTSYRYSGNVVYNNFPWAEATPAQVQTIEASAQAILDVRARYPDSTLADLYDPLTMPKDLRAAHRANDKAVAAAYGFEAILDDEAALVAELFKLYASLTNA